MPKKDFTSFDIAAVVHELKPAIPNSRVNNIYQLNDKTLLLKLHKTNTGTLRLMMEAGRRIHLTAYELEKPPAPPSFCMALRKHLRNAWLVDVDQHEFERIVTFNFETKTGKLRLILELFGDGNIILTGEKGDILQALIFKRMRDRNIVRGEVYLFPPSSGKNPFKITRDELAEAVKASGNIEVVRVLARFLGVGGVYAEETLLRAAVEKTKACAALMDSEITAIHDALQSLLSTVVESKIEPYVVLGEEGAFIDVVPFKLKRYEAFKTKTYSSFNEALDDFYLKYTAAEVTLGAAIQIDKIAKEAERLKRVIAEQEQTIREAEETAERDKHVGDAIYAHSGELQSLLDKFSDAKIKGREWSVVVSEILAAKRLGETPAGLFESFDVRNLAINVRIADLRFGLSLGKTIFENAAEFYDQGKRAKQKAGGAQVALDESRGKLAKIEQDIREAEMLKEGKPAEAMEKLVKRRVKSKKWYEKFRWFTSSDGFLVVAGKDAVSNEVLIKKFTKEDDVIFHADITGAPFVVVKTEGKTTSEQVLKEAGDFAAAFSRAWREGMGAVDVYWVKLDQLNKTGPSGESVPHGAFAVVGKRNWMRGVPLKLAVGVVEDGEVCFVGGPVDAVKARAKVYVTVVSGDVMGKEILKKILQALAVKLPKEQREKVAKASIEMIREFVPYTKGRLTEIL